MTEIEKILCERRSCRKYKEEQIPRDVLDRILKCGTYAPSGKNKQSAVIVVIQDRNTIEEIGKINSSFFIPDVDPFYGAPTLVVVFANKNIRTHVQDGSAVISNIIHAAYGLGVDSCWIHRAKETFDTEFGRALMEKWGLGENYVGVGNVILGYRDGDLLQPKPRKENYIIFAEEK